MNPFTLHELELLKHGMEMYAPKEGEHRPADAWYDIYFAHVPRLLATIDELQAKLNEEGASR